MQTLGPHIQWVQNFDDKICRVYIAQSAEILREHARRGQFPANRITEVKVVIDPTTAELSAGR